MMSFFNDSALVVTLSTVLFFALLIYLKVPGKVLALIDSRAERIRGELDEARRLREEAQAMLASYERKHKEVEAQVEHIVATAKSEAERAAKEAEEKLQTSIALRIKAAEDQIAASEAGALRDVRDRAIAVAVTAARSIITEKMDAKAGDAMIDESIKQVGAKLH